MNIFEAIRADHDIQRDLLDKLVETSGDTKVRHSLFLKLKDELITHENAEEKIFYRPLIDAEMTRKKARHSIAEHHEMDELLEKLSDTEMDSSAWLVYAKQLKEKVEHHLEEEEQEVFQMAGKVLNETQKKELATTYNDFMKKNRYSK